MVKGKIEVYCSDVIRSRLKPIQVALSQKTTCTEVIEVILKKYGLQNDDPFDFQIWMTDPGEAITKSAMHGTLFSCVFLLHVDTALRSRECPLVLLPSRKGKSRFHLKLRTSGVIRVHTNIEDDTFHSMIIQPHATTSQVAKQLADKYYQKWGPSCLELVEATVTSSWSALVHHCVLTTSTCI